MKRIDSTKRSQLKPVIGLLAFVGLSAVVGHAFVGVLLRSGDLVVAAAGIQRIQASGAQTTIASGQGCCGGQAVIIDGRAIVSTAGEPPRIVRVNSLTGSVRTISQGQFFRAPNSVAQEKTGSIVVTDHELRAVLRIDSRGNQSVLSANGHFVAPLSLAVAANGDIFVADSAAFGGGGGIIKVDPVTGQQTVISSGGQFYDPTGIALDRNGNIFIADPAGVAHQGGGPGRIIRVDSMIGTQTVISSANLLVDPWGITIADNGLIYVADPVGFSASARVVSVDPATGAQQIVPSGPLSGPTAIAIFDHD